MPVIKSAKKKLRQDIKRTKINKKLRTLLRDSLKKALKSQTPASITKAIKTADKAAKLKIIHKNKAARIKSKLAKLAGKTKTQSPKKEAPKKSKRKS